jgi:homocysteine S-methyltransferase
MTPRDQLDISRLRVLDGGLATELEYLGAKIDGPLWSAHVLEDQPYFISAVHRAYIEAGADCILTASYQVSRMGYAELGLEPSRADRALQHAVELSQAARRDHARKPVLIAASLGPYGAALHNGAEFHGNYSCSFAELVRFHRERIAVLAATEADLLAFETLPSLEEARAIAEALADYPNLTVWLSFTCRSGREIAHGEKVEEAAALAEALPQAVFVGLNCTAPALVAGILRRMRTATEKPLLAYPNSGEQWDATTRTWTGTSDPRSFGQAAREWFAAGAQMIGGCCRTRPAHIREVAALLPQLPLQPARKTRP